MLLQGQIITRFGADTIVQTENNETLRCTARKKHNTICCGDYVSIEKQKQGNATIHSIKTRKNALMRPDFRGKPRPVAANIDQLIIVIAWLPEPQWGALDRYIMAAHQLGVEPLIIMNKSDLTNQSNHKQSIKQHLAEFEQIGYTVLNTYFSDNAKDDEKEQQRQQLNDQLANKTSIFVGQSGVGKSTLSNIILQQTDIKTGGLSDIGEGKHTTTTTVLYQLDNNAKIIDSPGTRDYTMPTINDANLRLGYREFNPYADQCRFNDCTHNHEPACEVTRQLQQGNLPRFRYQRYLEQLNLIEDPTYP